MNEDKHELIQYYLGRADETFLDAKNLVNLNVKTHSGVRIMFNLHLVKEGHVNTELSSFYSLLMQRRGESDYVAFEKLTSEDVLPLIPQAEEFINTIKILLKEDSKTDNHDRD